MARIYSFMPRPPTANRRESLARGSATVIIFPGVRYERRQPEGGDAGNDGTGPSRPKAARTRR